MSIVQMAFREIQRHRFSFLFAVATVALAGGTLLGAHVSLERYRIGSRELLAEKEAELSKRLKILQDEMREATLKLSFNLVILPGEQDIREWHEQDCATTYMPEDYVHRMARSKILAVRHFLPLLAQKTKWPEMNRTVILAGCRGEVPNLHKAPRAPLVQPVPDGAMIVGYELWRSLGLQAGQKVRFMGREFVIHRCYDQRGSKDDIGVWIPLADAQQLLDKPGQLNAILALECVCVGDAGIEKVRAAMAECLPDTKVVEFGTKVLARGEARAKVKEEAIRAFQREKNGQTEQNALRRRLTSAIVATASFSCALTILLLASCNARKRRGEVAVLRALGFRASQILSLFLVRLLVAGIAGAVLGCAASVTIAVAIGLGNSVIATSEILPWYLVGATMAIALLLSIVGGWIPALLAARQDPAVVLVENGPC